MKKHIIAIIALLAMLSVALIAAGCSSNADVASSNLSKDADNFKVERRVVFFNGITDKYLLEIIGKCSVDLSRQRVITVTVKTGPNEYKKHYLGLSDNVSYFVEQLAPVPESTYFYKVNFKPTEIIPDIVIP